MRYSVLKRKMNFLPLTKIWSVLNNAWNKGEFLRSCFFIPCCWLVLKKWQSKNTTFFSEAWCKEWIKIITQLRIMSNKQFLELLYSTHYTCLYYRNTMQNENQGGNNFLKKRNNKRARTSPNTATYLTYNDRF